jgi:hypothetical protein
MPAIVGLGTGIALIALMAARSGYTILRPTSNDLVSSTANHAEVKAFLNRYPDASVNLYLLDCEGGGCEYGGEVAYSYSIKDAKGDTKQASLGVLMPIKQDFSTPPRHFSLFCSLRIEGQGQPEIIKIDGPRIYDVEEFLDNEKCPD